MDPFFTVDGDYYVPGPMARGPWGQTMGGQIVGGLLGWALDEFGDGEFQPARLTVDLLRPVPLDPVQVTTAVQREGRRIRLVDGALLQAGRVVARASALFLRRSEQPEGDVWSSVALMPPAPTSVDGPDREQPFAIWTYCANSQAGSVGIGAAEWQQASAQKFAWTRLFRPMVAGHPLTPFTRMAFAGDIISSLTHWGTAGLRYINADYTLTLSRLPQGDYIGLAADSHYGNAGVATGSATLFDLRGPIGTGSAIALAQSPDAFQLTHW